MMLVDITQKFWPYINGELGITKVILVYIEESMSVSCSPDNTEKHLLEALEDEGITDVILRRTYRHGNLTSSH